MQAALAALLLIIAAMPAHAQDPAPVLAAPQSQPEQPKPELIIGGQAPPPPVFERCVDVEIGTARSYGCLNETLRRGVDKVNPTLNLPPIDARSPDTRVGVVNIPAVQQQYGQNFGRSVVPFRLPQPVFNGHPR